MSKELILIKVNGPDRPGITHQLLDVISEAQCPVRDMGQSVTHGLLSLSILIAVESEDKEYPVIKELLFTAKKMGLTLDFEMIENGETLHTAHSEEKFILNCVSIQAIPSEFLRDVAAILSNNKINIHRIDTLDPNTFNSIEITTTVPSSVDLSYIKSELINISGVHQVDAAFIKDNVWRRNKRLIVFDMDSTLIQTEVIDELSIEQGVSDQVMAITEAAMNGEIDFDESLKERVKLLAGLSEESLHTVLKRLEFTPGAEKFIKTVKGLGYKVALISGGFSFFANALKDKLNLDYAFSNELEIVDGKLTGNVVGTIVNAQQKATLLKLISQQENINLEQVVAIGDGANDLPMLSVAGLGIAYHAKDIVQKEASNHMGHGPMTSILHFLGLTNPELF